MIWIDNRDGSRYDNNNNCKGLLKAYEGPAVILSTFYLAHLILQPLRLVTINPAVTMEQMEGQRLLFIYWKNFIFI